MSMVVKTLLVEFWTYYSLILGRPERMALLLLKWDEMKEWMRALMSDSDIY